MAQTNNFGVTPEQVGTTIAVLLTILGGGYLVLGCLNYFRQLRTPAPSSANFVTQDQAATTERNILKRIDDHETDERERMDRIYSSLNKLEITTARIWERMEMRGHHGN